MNEEILAVRKWVTENLTDANANDWSDADMFVNKIQPILPPNLELISLPPSYDEGKYNCFVYALGLQKDPIFLRKEKRPDLTTIVLIDSPKMLSLLSSLEKTDHPTGGDYVFYKNGRVITHGAVYLGDGMVESKWSDGPIFKHPTLAVNPTYGEDISFYKKSDPQRIKELLIAMDAEFKDRSKRMLNM